MSLWSRETKEMLGLAGYALGISAFLAGCVELAVTEGQNGWTLALLGILATFLARKLPVDLEIFFNETNTF